MSRNIFSRDYANKFKAFIRNFKQQQELDLKLNLLSNQLNKLTGYERIENLKNNVMKSEQDVNNWRKLLIDSKLDYNRLSDNRRSSQKQVNDLLNKKSSWNDEQLLSFTDLVKNDHQIEKLEKEALELVDKYESLVEKGFDKLVKSILERYHEEQIWSDKIRSLSSTYTLLALGINVIVFISAIIIIEPYKRKKMINELEVNLKNDKELFLSKFNEINSNFLSFINNSNNESLKDVDVERSQLSSIQPSSPTPSTTSNTIINKITKNKNILIGFVLGVTITLSTC